MRIEIAAWTAGILDGEGCITIVPRIRSDKRRRFDGFQMRVQVGNTDRRMIDRLVELWGGSVRYTQDGRPNRAGAYFWCVPATKAAVVLQACLPYLVTKAEQAQLACEFQTRLSNRTGRRGLTEPEIAVRTAMYEQMKQLNLKPGVRQNGKELDKEGRESRAQGLLHPDDQADLHAPAQGVGEAVQERRSGQGQMTPA